MVTVCGSEDSVSFVITRSSMQERMTDGASLVNISKVSSCVALVLHGISSKTMPKKVQYTFIYNIHISTFIFNIFLLPRNNSPQLLNKTFK